MRLACRAALALGLFSRFGYSGTLQGYVRNQQGTAVPAATVEVQIGHGESRAAKSDGTGRYRLLSLPAGSYMIRAHLASEGETTAGPVLLIADETKNINLVLKRAAAAVEFFDEPKFAVAGVTDGGYMGGHGSDNVLRSSETLTKAAAALSHKAASDEQTEQSLQAALGRDPDNPALHHSLADVYETGNEPLDAVREYERAAQLNPSEGNLYDWGTELLVHRAPEAAVEVFNKGIERFPGSSRMLLGAAAACYAHGDYALSAQRFFAAADLHPDDPVPYLFLGKIESPEIAMSDGLLNRLARFVQLQPDNAWANYCYASKLWARRKDPSETAILKQTQSLLLHAIALDPKLAVAYLQLGILESEKEDVPAAITAYQQAIARDSSLEQAHYRLAEAYRKRGEVKKAQQETEVFHELIKASSQKVARERLELQKFVVTLKTPAPSH